MDYYKQLQEQMKTVTVADLVKMNSACIGSPETCRRVLQHVADAGVDEALIFQQSFTTPHDKVMRSIELLARDVKPRLKATAKK
jgi:alkanesulfonate monooxygenase SsuD/methylene tetrahydromethanopterin reductase-like flavin-dependent oxidoreductase (luciferase family)